jgi:hypothetical protein
VCRADRDVHACRHTSRCGHDRCRECGEHGGHTRYCQSRPANVENAKERAALELRREEARTAIAEIRALLPLVEAALATTTLNPERIRTLLGSNGFGAEVWLLRRFLTMDGVIKAEPDERGPEPCGCAGSDELYCVKPSRGYMAIAVDRIAESSSEIADEHGFDVGAGDSPDAPPALDLAPADVVPQMMLF